MDLDWITSAAGRRVIAHEADTRPAWLWSQDGQTLLWRNDAALLFAARMKRSGLKLSPEIAPLKGQVARSIKLGSTGRSSLARLQFLAGEKPVSATCICTPLELPAAGQFALLVCGVDPIADDVLGAARGLLASGEAPLGEPHAERSIADPEPMPSHLVSVDTEVAEAEPLPDGVAPEPSGPPPDAIEPSVAAAFVPDADLEGQEATTVASEAHAVDAFAADAEDDGGTTATAELFAMIEPPQAIESTPEAIAPPPPGAGGRLSNLVDRLSRDDLLFAGLDALEPPDEAAPVAAPERDPALPPPLPPSEMPPSRALSTPTLFRVTGRGFARHAAAPAPVQVREDTDAENAHPVTIASLGRVETMDQPQPTVLTAGSVVDAESVERVSRYNFDELSRILTDRVGSDAGRALTSSNAPLPGTGGGALVNLGGETLVLNRLPLGILVFRDQQLLFANRAITEMTGYDSVESLRAAGLAGIFPPSDGSQQEAGPVNHLMQQGGTLIPVTARLQSISWQGRPALMLSASGTEVRTSHEAAVLAFAESMARSSGDGFLETSRAGVVSAASALGAALFDTPVEALAGRPLSALVDADDHLVLKEFMEKPARFAETARPCLAMRGKRADLSLLLYAQGQAGVVTGYFAFVRRSAGTIVATQPALPNGDPEPALLGRVSRGVRRPLNTIVGFSDLIGSAAFGPIENPRYQEYARDIASASREIAALVDELDDYARLKDGRYLPNLVDIDLAGLLESCISQVKSQAGDARVLVRSGISQRLPRVRADRASFGQAVLNLLASAIDQTPPSGSVILSAQQEGDGAVAIHIRDSARTTSDPSDRFVVFREGSARDGTALAPVRSSVGMALTRSLLAVNSSSLKVEPAGGTSSLFSLRVPPELVVQPTGSAP